MPGHIVLISHDTAKQHWMTSVIGAVTSQVLHILICAANHLRSSAAIQMGFPWESQARMGIWWEFPFPRTFLLCNNAGKHNHTRLSFLLWCTVYWCQRMLSVLK